MKRLIPILCLGLVAAFSSAAPVGVTVNGVDASALSGAGWAYDPATSNLVLSAAGPYVVSSAGAESRVQVVALDENGQLQNITLSNLVLAAQCPLALGEGAKAVVALAGTNVLTATKSGQPAILVPGGTSLMITNAPAADGLAGRPYLEATGANSAPGIGGAHNKAVGTIAITGGEIVARGGSSGAGIGAGQGGYGGAVEITGGLVDARATSSAAGIGGGNNGRGPAVAISGGTVVAKGFNTVDIGPSAGAASTTSTQTVTIVGGSVHVIAGRINPAPTNGVARIWCVTVGGLTPGEDVELALTEENAGLAPGRYGTDGIVADEEGKVYLWLPNGDYELAIGETRYTATVDGANTEATPFVPPLPPLGVFVNGVDACEGAGKGWSYDRTTSNIVLSARGPFVISGTNTEGAVQVLCSAVPGGGTTRVVLSNLVLAAQCPLALAEGVKAAIALSGTNTLTATESGRPAILLPAGATVEIAVNNSSSRPCLAAAGGDGAPAIGGDGALAISGGMISSAGNGAALAAGSLSISGGTVQAAAVVASEGAVTITGGSLNTASADVSPAPSNGVERVWRVTVGGFAPGENAGLALGAQDRYGTNGIVADEEGKVYIWLPDGEHELTIGETRYTATVDGADTEATPVEPTPQPPLPPLGIFVNGVDACEGAGAGWSYSDGKLTLDGAGPFVVSGTNTEGAVQVLCSAVPGGGATQVVLSNLVLAAQCPLALVEGAEAVVALAGTNLLTATKSGQPAILVPRGTSLTITNAPAADGLAGRPYLEATGANYAPGIGGARSGSVGTIAITGGEIVAHGGSYGAGIGAGQGGAGGMVEISGGIVNATGGSAGAGIGGGNNGRGPAVAISGGTVVAHGVNTVDLGPSAGAATTSSTQTVTIVGGSVHAIAGRINPAPTNGVACIWCVTVGNLTPGGEVELALTEENAGLALDKYGTNGIVADEEGKIYLWLPDGDYVVSAGTGDYWTATVAGKNVVATYYSAKPDAIHIDSIAVGGGAVTIVATVTPASWLEGHAEDLRVRAAAALPLPEGDEALLDASEVETTANGGTATLVFPAPALPACFFRIEVP